VGLLSSKGQFGFRNLSAVQYWQSATQLQDFAHSADKTQLPAWRAFNRAVGSNGDVGIWHETYVVAPDNLESIYLNMPRHGLGRVGTLFPAKGGRASAAKRLGLTSGARA
jgi:hypothetical protein